MRLCLRLLREKPDGGVPARARARPRQFHHEVKIMTSRAPDMPIVEIDGLPYVDTNWLEWRIYRDEVRFKRWRQEAGRMAGRTDADGMLLHRAYLWHALQATYRADRWRRCLTLTLAAIEKRQRNAMIEFGWLVKDRRTAAGMTQRDVASCAGLDSKTVGNIESASFSPNRRTLELLIAVNELKMSWEDVSPVLLESNAADGRKHRTNKKSRLNRSQMLSARLSAHHNVPK